MKSSLIITLILTALLNVIVSDIIIADDDIKTFLRDEYNGGYDENVWSGISEGIFPWDISNIKYAKYTTREGLVYYKIDTLDIAPYGFLWMAMAEHLSGFEEQKWITTNVILASINIETVSIDSKGEIYFNSSDEKYIYNGDLWLLLSNNTHSKENDVTSITIDNEGIIWITIKGWGLFRYNPNPTYVEEDEDVPSDTIISSNYPNPFNPSTTIEYNIPETDYVRLVIYDTLGREVTVLQDGMMSAGNHNTVWDGKSITGELVGSGVYIYRFNAGDFIDQGKILLLR